MTKVLTGMGCLALVTFLYVPTGAAAPVSSVVAKDSLCSVLDANQGIAAGNHSMILSNRGGQSMVKCTVKDVPNPTGRAVHFDFDNTGMMCVTAAGPTTDWHETISASGNATLMCRMKS